MRMDGKQAKIFWKADRRVVMKPHQKRVILFLAILAPGMLVLMFAFWQYPSNTLPVWIPVSWGFYVLAAITFMTLFGRQIIKSPSDSRRAPGGQASATMGGISLITVWSAFFLYSAFKFLKGDIPVSRAVPAGALLMAFILVFSWLMRRDMKSRRAANGAPSSDGADSIHT
jgi:hypothetical protein